MDIQIRNLPDPAGQAPAPSSLSSAAASESFRDILSEFAVTEAETSPPPAAPLADLAFAHPSASQDTVDSIKAQTQDNLSWQAYYTSGGHFQLGERFTMPHVLPSHEEAVRAIGPGGPYSVEAVSNCILSMAAHVAQGNPEKIAEIRQEIEKAVAIFRRDYQAATKEKDLPQICLSTYDAIMTGLDKLQAEYTQNNEAATQTA